MGNQSHVERDRVQRPPARRAGRTHAGRGTGASQRRGVLQRRASSRSTRHWGTVAHGSWISWPRRRRGKPGSTSSTRPLATSRRSDPCARGGVAPPATRSVPRARRASSPSWTRPAGAGATSPSASGASSASPRRPTRGCCASSRRPRCSMQPQISRSLADVAMSAGYYDQSHLTRDFAALAGMTPGAYAADATEIPEVRFLQDPEEPVPA